MGRTVPKSCVQVVIPTTCQCDQIWKMGLCRCHQAKNFEMTSVWKGVDPKCSDGCPYKRKGGNHGRWEGCSHKPRDPQTLKRQEGNSEFLECGLANNLHLGLLVSRPVEKVSVGPF